jgi:hypothetical protein
LFTFTKYVAIEGPRNEESDFGILDTRLPYWNKKPRNLLYGGKTGIWHSKPTAMEMVNMVYGPVLYWIGKIGVEERKIIGHDNIVV